MTGDYKMKCSLLVIAALVVTSGFTVAEEPATSQAAEVTFEQAMEQWSFMEGEWTVHLQDGTTTKYACKKGDNASCYLITMEQLHGIATYDGAKKQMIIFASHPEGTYSCGHWAFKSPKIIEGGFTATQADGTSEKHTGRFEIMGKDEYTYAIDGELYGRFTRE
jgi:hypothetical protein